jgi:hypothetical protein
LFDWDFLQEIITSWSLGIQDPFPISLAARDPMPKVEKMGEAFVLLVEAFNLVFII